MKFYRIELLEPKAKKLLQELVNLNLIRVHEEPRPAKEFSSLLLKIRDQDKEPLSLEDIAAEVELVRKKRYAKRKKD